MSVNRLVAATRLEAILGAMLVAAVAAGCAAGPTTSEQQSSRPDTARASATQVRPSPVVSPSAQSSYPPVPGSPAMGALRKIPVKGRAPQTGYSRERFGVAWTDVNRNGCDTRDDILKRDLTNQSSRGTCVISGGSLNDPYTGRVVRYVRGASVVDIDHVVALDDAWQTGAFAWPFAKRVALANDPLNLLAVDAATNRQKGAGDAATWLPPNKSFRCAYVARQVAVKRKYQLWVTPSEAAAVGRVLSRCPGKNLPGPGAQPTIASNTGGSDPGSVQAPLGSNPNSGSGVFFANCAAARAAGAAPLRRGTKPYAVNSHLDHDNDGVACE